MPAQFLPPPALPRDSFSAEIDANATKQITALRDNLRAGQYAEGVSLLLKLAETRSDKFLEVSPGRFVSPRVMAEIFAASLPPEALRIYRAQVDPLAERIREQMKQEGESVLGWKRILQQGYASHLGDEALSQLALSAWEQGEIAKARSLWESLIPPRSNGGQESIPYYFAYPDTDLDLSDIRAKLILCSVLLEDLSRAEQELEVFRTLHPDSRGVVAGVEGKLVDLLAGFLKQSRNWNRSRLNSQARTFAGEATRNSIGSGVAEILAPLWSVPLKGYLPLLRGKRPVNLESYRPSCFPVVSGQKVFWSSDETVFGCDLLNGQPLWGGGANSSAGQFEDRYQIYQAPVSDRPLVNKDELNEGEGDKRLQERSERTSFSGLPQFTVTVADGRLYARLRSRTSPLESSYGQGEPGRLVCLDILQGEGKLLWDADCKDWKEGDLEWRFEGTPVAQGGRIYVGMNSAGARRMTGVAALNAETGERIWFRKFGELQSLGFSVSERLSHGLICIGEGSIFYSTGGGGLVALDLETGEPRWLIAFPANEQSTGVSVSPLLWDRMEAPVWDRGVVYVLGNDGKSLVAVDGWSGMTIWSRFLGAPAQWILGCQGDRVIVSGERLWGIDRRSGGIRWEVGSRDVELQGYARGAVVGTEVWWPFREELVVVDQESGRLRRRYPSTSSWGMGGGHLTVIRGGLLLSEPTKLNLMPLAEVSQPVNKGPDVKVSKGQKFSKPASPIPLSPVSLSTFVPQQ